MYTLKTRLLMRLYVLHASMVFIWPDSSVNESILTSDGFLTPKEYRCSKYTPFFLAYANTSRIIHQYKFVAVLSCLVSKNLIKKNARFLNEVKKNSEVKESHIKTRLLMRIYVLHASMVFICTGSSEIER